MPRVGRRRRVVQSSTDDDDGGLNGTLSREGQAADAAWSLDFEELKGAPRKRPVGTERQPRFDLDRIYNTHQLAIPEDELVVHRKKVAEVEAWFKDFQVRLKTSTPAILMVTGPTGSGKTTCVRHLCQKYSIRIQDGMEEDYHCFIPHSESPASTLASTLTPIPPSCRSPRRLPKTDRLSNLCLFPSLRLMAAGEEEEEKEEAVTTNTTTSVMPPTSDARPAVVLWDHLPSVETGTLVEQALFVTGEGPLLPLQVILIVTDPCGSRSWTDDVLLRRIRRHPQTTLVAFNPIAPSFVHRLRRRGGRATPSGSTTGDLRASLLDDYLEGRLGATAHGRDASFSIFHTVGKILHPREAKGKERPDVAALTETDRPSLHGFLHANYPKLIADPAALAAISHEFSHLDAVPWRVRLDPLWEASYSALPEMTIQFHANLCTRPDAPAFTSIEAPDSRWWHTGPRLGATHGDADEPVNVPTK